MVISEELKKLISEEVQKQLNIEKKSLAEKITKELEYTGKYAKAYLLMQVFKKW